MSTTRNLKEGNKAFLEVFGFISNQARMNLIVFFYIILIFSNVFFVWRNMSLQKEVREVEKEKTQLIYDLNKQISDEIRKQIKPASYQIQEALNKIDSLTIKK